LKQARMQVGPVRDGLRAGPLFCSKHLKNCVVMRPLPCDSGFMTTLVIATRNRHKVEEIGAILGSAFHFLSLADFTDAPVVIEDAPTFAGNATKKAVTLARHLSSLPVRDPLLKYPIFVLADDSGLEVDALDGAPGVHSARFAALDKTANSSDPDNNAKLLRLLKDVSVEKRTARFRCVLALTPVLERSATSASPVCAADEFELQMELFDGACEGRIGYAPAGQGGFGYDPLFIPSGWKQSFGELGEDVKNLISHRARALAELRERLGKRGLQ
jgi:XTP/dITP diphosphohydrolase